MWIHERAKWPNFTWDAEYLSTKLADLRFQQGKLLGTMETIGFELRNEASLRIITDDVISSSAIEGENLNYEEVRSSVARRLGMDIRGLVPANRDVEGVVEMMLDATQGFQKTLTRTRLFNWHASLFPTGRSGMQKITVGKWRTVASGPMQVISGPMGKEKVHFEAPHASRLAGEMSAFLKWFGTKNDVDSILRAGITHFWFVTIHPFEDGNGRIARAVGDLALAQADGMAERFYSLSTQIESQKKEYYEIIELQQRGTLDITPWLNWFLEVLGAAIKRPEGVVNSVLLKAQVWENLRQKPVNDRQRLIINRMLDDGFQGFMNSSKYAKLSKCSPDTALRDIQALVSFGVLEKNPGGGRSTSYRIAKLH